MPAFQVFGIASGLDTQNIIEQLMAIERRPLDLLETREQDLQEKIGLWQDFHSRAITLRDTVYNLGQPGTLENVTATSSNEDAITATASSSALPGVYSFRVAQLALNSVRVGDPSTTYQINDPDAPLGNFNYDDGGGGQIRIRIPGDGVDTIITWDETTDSLNDIAQKINDLGIAATASVIDKDGDGTNYVLMVVGKKTGYDYRVLMSDVNGNFRNNHDIGHRVAQDAILEVEDNDQSPTQFIQITRSTNTITDLIEGVTLELKSTTTDMVNITVGPDLDADAAQVQSFVDALNNFRTFVNEQTAFDEGAEEQAPLFGDTLLTRINSELQLRLASQYTVTGNVSSLIQLGITFNHETGLYELDSSKLNSLLETDHDSVVEFFQVLANNLARTDKTGWLDQVSDSVDGRIKTRIDFLNSEIEDLQEAQKRMEERLAKKQQLLEEQFLRLEQTLAQLQQQAAQFEAQLAALSSLRPRTSSGGGLFGGGS